MSGRDDTILELIDQVTVLAETKASNTELCLYRWGREHTWRCMVGNPSRHTCIGETAGEFRGEGATLVAALHDLMKNLRGAP